MTTEGPFGKAAQSGGAVDLDALAAARAAQEQGLMHPAIALQVLGQQFINELAGIRTALTPPAQKLHIPAVLTVTDKDRKLMGYGVFCIQCSDEAGDMIYPCRVRTLEQMVDWPPNILIAADYAKSAEQVLAEDIEDQVNTSDGG